MRTIILLTLAVGVLIGCQPTPGDHDRLHMESHDAHNQALYGGNRAEALARIDRLTVEHHRLYGKCRL